MATKSIKWVPDTQQGSYAGFSGSWPLSRVPSEGWAGKSCGMATALLPGAWVLNAALSGTH